MEGAYFLIVLSFLMFFASYGACFVPLILTFSEVRYSSAVKLIQIHFTHLMHHFYQAKLQIVSVFGAGLLVGTALAVIIPEGVRLLYFALIESVASEKLKIQFTYHFRVSLS